MSTSISCPVFILSSVLWSLSMVEWLSASRGSESISAYPPFLSAISISFQTTFILLRYEGHESIVCAMTEMGHLNNSLDKAFASSALLWPPQVSPLAKAKRCYVDTIAPKEIWIKTISTKQDK